MANFDIPVDPEFIDQIRMFETTDPAHAILLNGVIGPLLNNDVYLNRAVDASYQQATGYTDQKIADLINGAPSTLDTLGEIAQAMRENDNVVDALDAAIGTKASQAEVDSHTGNNTIHIMASERQTWNSKQSTTGDTKDNTVAFTSGDSISPTGWANVDLITSGEKHSSLWRKVSLFTKNMRYLWKLMGSTSLSGIGDGTVTGAISALNTGLMWKYAGHVTGIDRLSLPSHREAWIAVDFQSDASYRRALLIPNIGAFETDLYGEIDGITDCVHIYYHQSVVGMYPKTDNKGTENLKLSAWYR